MKPSRLLFSKAQAGEGGEDDEQARNALQAQLQQTVALLASHLWQWRKPLFAGAVVVLIGGAAASGFYRIQPNELGIVLRFGEWSGEAQAPGLHYRLPWPMTTLTRVEPQKVQCIEVGFRTKGVRGEVIEPAAYLWETMHQAGIYEKKPLESVMLTGDKNEVDVNFAVEYHIREDAVGHYLFRLANSADLVRASAESCGRRVIGSMPLNEVLTTDRSKVEAGIHERLQATLDRYEAGVQINSIRLQDIHPPVEVVPAFRRVATAREDRITQVNRAIAFQRANIPKARGGAKYIEADAEAHKLEMAARAEGDVAYFKAMSAAYSEAPEAIRFLMYMDTVEEVLPSLKKVLYSPESAQKASKNTVQNYFLGGELLKKALVEYAPLAAMEQ